MKNSFCLFAIFFLYCVSCLGITVNYQSAVLSGSGIITGSTCNAKETVPPTLTYADNSISNKVRIWINRDNLAYVAAYSITINLKIDYMDATNTLVTVNTPLTLSYDPSAATEYTDQSVYTFAGSKDVTVTVVNINGFTTTPAPVNMNLQTTIDIDRTFSFDGTSQPDGNNLIVSLASASEIQVSWTPITGAEAYDLEWTFANDYAGTSLTDYSDASTVYYNFKRNATRVSIPDNGAANLTYRIANTFEHGYLLFRVRGVGRNMATPFNKIVGKWTSDIITPSNAAVSDFIGQFPSAGWLQTAGHEQNKNWQYAASFAEEGKKKEVISYFDGSDRNRQSVTKSNTDQIALVGETIYDYQGRGAVQALPVPSGTSIQYYPNFNLNNSSTSGTKIPYSRNDFDTDVTPGSCTVNTAGMSTLDGASLYYSPTNPDKTAAQAYVPDALKYPFTQVEYTPDNTGRIRRQSGVGINHALGSGHETKYYYGQPLQLQLDRLFGSEAGNNLHYKKNMVVDPNGQVSVSYLDMHGRVVATSLAGNVTTNLVGLPDEATAAKAITGADLFSKDANGISISNKPGVEGNSVVFSTQILVPVNNSSYTFNYDVTPEKYQADGCLNAGICLDCIYDLEISLTDECGTILTPGGVPIKKTIGPVDGSGNAIIDLACAGVNTVSSFTATLNIGTYNLTKKLTVNAASLEKYVDLFILTGNNSCVQTEQSFINTETAKIDPASCDITCATCISSLGTKPIDPVAGAKWQKSYDQCQSMCKSVTPCTMAYQMMLSDVSPGGQYAQYRDDQGNVNPANFPVSVLNTSNLLPDRTTANWKNPKITTAGVAVNEYHNADQTRSKIPVSFKNNIPVPATTATLKANPDGSLYIYPEELSNVSDFISYWQKSWALSLVEYHPEYAYFDWCKDNGVIQAGATRSSENFDSLMYATSTYAGAVAAGLLSTTNSTISPLTTDPYFNTNGKGINQNTAMFNVLASYKSGLSAKAFVSLTTRCGSWFGANYAASCTTSFGAAVGTATLTATQTQDREWLNYRMIYMAEKQKQQQKNADAYALTKKRYNDCIEQKEVKNIFSTQLFDQTTIFNSPYFDPLQVCSYYTRALYKDKIKRFRNEGDVIDIGIDPNADPLAAANALKTRSDFEWYNQTGQCPDAHELEGLLNALAVKNTLTSATSIPMQSYPEFSYGLYTEVKGGIITTNYINPTWSAALSGQLLTGSFLVNGGAASGYTVNLTLPAGYAWTSFTGGTPTYTISKLQQLKFLFLATGIYSFELTAVLTNGTSLTLIGQTQLTIGNCSFPNQCKANDFAKDLATLWSVLAKTGKLTSTTDVPLSADPYYKTLLTPAILANLGVSSNWNWKEYNSTLHSIYDPNSNAKSIEIQLPYNSSVLSAFSNIKPIDVLNPLGSYTATAYNSTLASNVSISGSVYNNQSDIYFNLGTCELIPVECNTPAHTRGKDLEGFLKAMVNKGKLVSGPPYDLNTEPAFTAALRSQFADPNLTWTVATTTQTLTGNFVNASNVVVGTITLANPNIDFNAGLNTLLYGFTATNLVNNEAYNFNIYTPTSSESEEVLTGTCSFPINTCNATGSPVVGPPLTLATPVITTPNPCLQYLTDVATANGHNAYTNYIQTVKNQFRQAYITKCLGAVENLKLNYTDKEYQFTLYYYDQAGNLVRTIPPEGINLVTATADLAQIVSDRTFKTSVFATSHKYPTTYTYNSLNQLIRQSSPDQDNINSYTNTLATGLPGTLVVTGTRFTSATTGFLTGNIGTDGYIYVTTDGGASWTPLSSVGVLDLNSISMFTATLGFAIGDGGLLLKTTDGGLTWTRVAIATKAKFNILTVSGTTGVAGAADGTFIYTTTSGTTWTIGGTLIGVNVTGLTVQGTNVFASGTNATGDGVLYSTTTTLWGSTWTPRTSIRTSGLTAVQFINTTTGFAVGPDGTLLKTTTTGTTWRAIATGGVDKFIDIYFSDVNNGLAVSDLGAVWKTTTGGAAVGAAPGWTKITALTGNYKDVCYFSGLYAYVVGAAGEVSRTTNGGTSWTKFTIGAANLLAGYFIDQNSGYITGVGKNVYNITNASTTFNIRTFTAPSGVTAASFNKVNFSSTTIGNVITDAGKIYVITNAATTPVWTLFSSTQVFADFSFIRTTPLTGYAISASTGAIVKTTTGSTWATYGTFAPTTSTTYTGIYTQAAAEVYLVGSTGDIKKVTSTTLSSNYTTTVIPLPLTKIMSPVAGTIYAVGADGTILKTTDTGASWTIKFSGTANNLNGLSFSSNILGLMVGDKGTILKTTDGLGATPVNSLPAISNPVTTNLYDVKLSGANAFVSGQGGTVLKSVNTGTSWPALPVPPTTSDLMGIASFDNTIINTVGKNGTMLRYNGTSWTNVAVIKPPVLNATAMAPNGSLIGYAVGNGGAILKTVNGGNTWTELNSGVTNNLNSVSFVSDLTGYAVGATGKAITTVNGGTTWTAIAQITGTSNLNKVFFDLPTHGCVVGDAGTIWITSNSGGLWTKVTPAPTANNLNSVFLTGSIGYAVGNAGTILKTTDGGTTWVAQIKNAGTWPFFLTGTNVNLRDVLFKDYIVGYAVGLSGLIMKTIDGGANWTQSVSNTTTTQFNSISFTDQNALIIGGTGPSTLKITDENDLYASKFWYDRLGRLAASQNVKQAALVTPAYSYTIYDALGRISEVGQIATTTKMDANYVSGVLSDAAFTVWLNAGTKTEMTHTYYDTPLVNAALSAVFTGGQVNLRGRVASATYEETDDHNPATYDIGTHYSYDVHGNVQTLVQENNLLLAAHQYKKTDYEYDLVSGKVNAVHYQQGQADQFHHKYIYDADNRITKVSTSKDGIIWDEDARYNYYKHGPLARTEIGDNKVQGMDYAYTLQGWIKGVNSNTLVRNRDIGKDGFQANDAGSNGVFVDWLYTTLLDRAAEPAGRADWISQIEAGLSREYAIVLFCTGSEFQDLAGIPHTSAGFVNRAYFKLLGRMPSPSELNSWVFLIDHDMHGNIPMSMVTQIEFSDEYLRIFIRAQYAKILHQVPDAAVENSLAAQMAGGLSEIGLINMLLSQSNVAQDVFGYTLGYFAGDYAAIGQPTTDNNFEAYLGIPTAKSDLLNNNKDLYNGNINHMVTALSQYMPVTFFPVGGGNNDLQASYVSPQAVSYQYDQLNRIKATQVFNNANVTTNAWGTGTPLINNYKESFTYDRNGNILAATRNDSAGANMDNLTYNYENKLTGYTRNTNRLKYVGDATTTASNPNDIESGQTTTNYTYDALGNLIGDAQEKIQAITWSVYGKVKTVTHVPGNSKDDIEFKYDAAGNRIAKIIKPAATVANANTWKITLYVRDASGNTMAIYNQDKVTNQVLLSEQPVYGSSRLGVLRRDLNVTTPSTPTNIVSRTAGRKQFELSNHLGNVLATVSDRRKTVSAIPIVEHHFAVNGEGWTNDPAVTYDAPNQRIFWSTTQQWVSPEKYFPTVPGQAYQISFKLASITGSVCAEVYPEQPFGGRLAFMYPGNGTYQLTFTATTIQSRLRIEKTDATGTTTSYYLDDVVITPLPTFTADVVSSQDYYAFGMLMPGRNFTSANQYRFGFNGKEKDDEVKGSSGTSYDYGMRMYDPRVGRFLSVDPITRQYPELTPYQFASNRPIDGIDLDGLEYATFTIFVQYGKVKNITVATDYELKNKNTLGPGVQLNYAYLDKNGKVIKFEAQPNIANSVYGIYGGDKNPQLPKKGGDPNKLFDDYSLAPIDETDAGAKKHDINYDKDNLKGFSGVMDAKSTPANNALIKDATNVLDKVAKKENDAITNKPVTEKAAKAASFMKKGFSAAETLKNATK